jgi:hypothetical protein
MYFNRPNKGCANLSDRTQIQTREKYSSMNTVIDRFSNT